MALDELYRNLIFSSCGSTNIATSRDYDHCRQVMLQASKNYSFASNFLPQDKLKHVEALYAFLRVGDDRVDLSHGGFDSPLAAIEDWERTYWDAFDSCESSDPVLRAYLTTANVCQIPPELMRAYFRAMKQDLNITRFATFDDLMHYMEGSAMIVGRAMTHILGIRPGLTFLQVMPYADALSIAMQLSNFWRDIAYDWSIGRVYIPQEDLARFGVSEDDIAAGRITPAFIQLMEFEMHRTEQYYLRARQGVAMLNSGRWGVMSGLEIYRAILAGIRRNRYDVFHHRAGSSTPQKVGLVARAWWNSRTP